MQTRLILVSKLNRIFFPTSKYQTAFSSAASHGGDPQMEDAMTQGVDTEGETNPHHHHHHHHQEFPTKDENLYMHPKTVPPNLSSSKLETPGVNKPFDPHHQQKRTKEELSCAGLDGSPWPADHDQTEDDDDKHYFEHHKASPLSEIEILDSRKPLARVTDGTAGGYFGDQQVITWRPEQLDTAEESLLRATEMFREAARRGVPEWPHSRRLRQLRGEDCIKQPKIRPKHKQPKSCKRKEKKKKQQQAAAQDQQREEIERETWVRGSWFVGFEAGANVGRKSEKRQRGGDKVVGRLTTKGLSIERKQSTERGWEQQLESRAERD